MSTDLATRKRQLSFGMDKFSALYLWAGFIILFSIWEGHLFDTASTVHQIASGSAIDAMVSLAVLIPLAAGAFDLSVGSVINLSAVLVTITQDDHWGMVTSILFVVVLCAGIGVINGFFVVVIGVDSFIVTLGTATIIEAFQVIVSNNNQPLSVIDQAFTSIGSGTLFGFQAIFFYVIVLALILWWLLDHTPVGRYLYATGGNSEAARLSGVRTGKWTWISLILSATICGVAGVFYASVFGPSLTFGQSLLLPAFAAVFLGSTQFTPGRYNVWGTFVAVYVLATGVEGLQLLTGVQWLNDMFSGVALLGAVSFAVWRQRAKTEREGVSDATTTAGEADDPLQREPSLGDSNPIVPQDEGLDTDNHRWHPQQFDKETK